MSGARTLCDKKTADVEMGTISSTETRKNWTAGKFTNLITTAKHNLNGRTLSDAILGLSDGLTVPFALTAGLASVGTTRIVVLGGLAELVAGAISMGVGGFVGAHSEQDSYQETQRKCRRLISESPTEVVAILQGCFMNLDLDEEMSQRIAHVLASKDNAGLETFILKHHFDAIDPGTSRPFVAGFTLGLAYFVGGFIALVPYLAVPRNEVLTGLWWSIGLMGVVLLVFGYVKTCLVRGWHGFANVLAGIRGAIQMLAVGAIAAGAAVGLVRAIEHGGQYGS